VYKKLQNVPNGEKQILSAHTMNLICPNFGITFGKTVFGFFDSDNSFHLCLEGMCKTNSAVKTVKNNYSIIERLSATQEALFIS